MIGFINSTILLKAHALSVRTDMPSLYPWEVPTFPITREHTAYYFPKFQGQTCAHPVANIQKYCEILTIFIAFQQKHRTNVNQMSVLETGRPGLMHFPTVIDNMPKGFRQETLLFLKNVSLTNKTIDNYLSYVSDSLLIEKAIRYDIKGKKYINTLAKYYFTDIGVRNAILDFRRQEENHIMENVIYNIPSRKPSLLKTTSSPNAMKTVSSH